MDDEPVSVPPEVFDDLKNIYQSDEIGSNDRDRAIDQAEEMDAEPTVKWLEQIDDAIYTKSHRDGIVDAGDKSREEE